MDEEIKNAIKYLRKLEKMYHEECDDTCYYKGYLEMAIRALQNMSYYNEDDDE